MTTPAGDTPPDWRGVGVAFLRLGLTAFGGPVAHLAWFRDAFVTRRRWIGEADYAALVAVAQALPGPTSSQVGFALGWRWAGPAGALAAFVAFTLPSALLMLAFAAAQGRWSVDAGVLMGLKAATAAIVAQAVIQMARQTTPDAPRLAIAVCVALGVLILPTTAWTQASLVAAAAVLGFLARGKGAGVAHEPDPAPRRIPRLGPACLGLFLILLAALPLAARLTGAEWAALADGFYRSGALVFGGGHVVLPLLQQAVVEPGWVAPDAFLSGYAAAQALPGPLFSFGAYLGAVSSVGPGGVAGGLLALGFIFLPGLLLAAGMADLMPVLARNRRAAGGLAFAAAAGTGLLAAALVNPVAGEALTGPAAVAIALGSFVLLTVLRASPVVVVALAATAGLIAG